MGRRPKVSSGWTPDENLHIIRLCEGSMKELDKVGKGANGNVYYSVDKDGVYHVVDTRGSKCNEIDFKSAEELMKYYSK